MQPYSGGAVVSQPKSCAMRRQRVSSDSFGYRWMALSLRQVATILRPIGQSSAGVRPDVTSDMAAGRLLE
jgi:hypothetical protein